MDILVNKLVNRIANLIFSNTLVAKEDKDKIRYALIVIINEFLKLSILFIVFFFMGKLSYFILSLIVLLTIRTFSGGRHYNSSFQCLIISAIFFFITCVVAVDCFTLPAKLIYFIMFLSLIITIIFSPFPNPKRPIRHKKRRWHLKLASILLSILAATLLLFLTTEKLLYCGTITMLLQSLQLVHVRKELI